MPRLLLQRPHQTMRSIDASAEATGSFLEVQPLQILPIRLICQVKTELMEKTFHIALLKPEMPPLIYLCHGLSDPQILNLSFCDLLVFINFLKSLKLKILKASRFTQKPAKSCGRLFNL